MKLFIIFSFSTFNFCWFITNGFLNFLILSSLLFWLVKKLSILMFFQNHLLFLSVLFIDLLNSQILIISFLLLFFGYFQNVEFIFLNEDFSSFFKIGANIICVDFVSIQLKIFSNFPVVILSDVLHFQIFEEFPTVFFFVVVVVSNLILVYLKNILSITLILLSLSLVSWCSSCHILKNISCALGKATNYVCCILQMRIKLVNSSSLLYPCLLLKCSCFSNYWEFGIDIFDLSVLLVDNMHWMLHFHLAFWLDD